MPLRVWAICVSDEDCYCVQMYDGIFYCVYYAVERDIVRAIAICIGDGEFDYVRIGMEIATVYVWAMETEDVVERGMNSVAVCRWA